MASNNRVLTVQMPESLYDSFIELAWERRMTAGKLVRTEIERMLMDRGSRSKFVEPSFLADAVRQSHGHMDTETIHALFQDRSNEEGWYSVARFLADEVGRLETLHGNVIAAIRGQGSSM